MRALASAPCTGGCPPRTRWTRWTRPAAGTTHQSVRNNLVDSVFEKIRKTLEGGEEVSGPDSETSRQTRAKELAGTVEAIRVLARDKVRSHAFGYFDYTPARDAVPNVQEAAVTTLSPARALPSAAEVALARESSRTLSAYLQTRAETQQIEIVDDQGAAHPVRVPVSALRLLVDLLTEIGAGNAVSIIPIHAELTTQDAADVLNVSRPFLVQLLERGEMPFHKIGTHRRVRYQDVIAYKERIDVERNKVLDALAEQAQELKMGYE
jgi:excisionase family DNA binding protein